MLCYSNWTDKKLTFINCRPISPLSSGILRQLALTLALALAMSRSFRSQAANVVTYHLLNCIIISSSSRVDALHGRSRRTVDHIIQSKHHRHHQLACLIGRSTADRLWPLARLSNNRISPRPARPTSNCDRSATRWRPASRDPSAIRLAATGDRTLETSRRTDNRIWVNAATSVAACVTPSYARWRSVQSLKPRQWHHL